MSYRSPVSPIVQDNINIFQGAYPDVSVKLSSFTWQTFHETMVNRFRSKTRPPVRRAHQAPSGRRFRRPA